MCNVNVWAISAFVFANILILPKIIKCTHWIEIKDKRGEITSWCTQETGRLNQLLPPISVSFFVCNWWQLLWKNLPLIAEDGPEAITQALVTIGVTASPPLDLESVRTKKFSLHILTETGYCIWSHLGVKSIQNKCDLIINELTAHLLGSPFICAFFHSPATRSPQHRGELKHLFNPTDPISRRLPGTRPVAASFSAANTLLSRLKQLFSYV